MTQVDAGKRTGDTPAAPVPAAHAVMIAERDAAVLRALTETTHRPLKAIELSATCGGADGHYVAGNWTHETARRRIRECVVRLREQGQRICADCSIPGYWLARSDDEWREYLEARKANAKFEFVAVRKMQSAASEKTVGQGVLFAGVDKRPPWEVEA